MDPETVLTAIESEEEDFSEEIELYEYTQKKLVLACEDGDLEMVQNLIEKDGGDNQETGLSVLMVAASGGHVEIVRYLLAEGAPWNAVDRSHLCAGDYAVKHNQQACVDVLISHAVTSELLLSCAISRKHVTTTFDTAEERNNDTETLCIEESAIYSGPHNQLSNANVPHLNASYLTSQLNYCDDGHRLVDKSTNLAVMMDWERPLMARHAAWICHATGETPDAHTDIPSISVLNVGFGMGIVDAEIQKYQPENHVVIEAHPEVLKKMESDGWLTKPGFRVLKCRWQTAVSQLASEIKDGSIPPFDGIFFDTYAEDDFDLREFHTWLPALLRKPSIVNGDGGGTPSVAGRYSYYNGLCPDNVFFHGVACETMRLHLKRLGLDCVFEPIPVDVSDPELWKDLASRYWYFDTYYLPKCTMTSLNENT